MMSSTTRRKGSTETKLLVLVLFVLSLFAMILFVTRLKGSLSAHEIEDTCRNSVANALRFYELNPSSMTLDRAARSLRCKTISVDSEADRAELVRAAIAKQTLRCSGLFHGGRHFFGGEGTYCHVCYTIAFPKAKGLKVAGLAYDPDMRQVGDFGVSEPVDTSLSQAIIYAQADGVEQVKPLLKGLSAQPSEFGTYFSAFYVRPHDPKNPDVLAKALRELGCTV